MAIMIVSFSLSFFLGCTATWYYRERLEKKSAATVAEVAYETAFENFKKEFAPSSQKKATSKLMISAVLYGGKHDGTMLEVPNDVENISYHGEVYTFANRTEKDSGSWIFSCC